MEEQYEFNWIPFEEIGNSKAIKLQLLGDIHVHKTFYKWSNLFDILLHPYIEALNEGKKLFPNKKHIWYPSAMDGRYYYFKNLPKIYEVVWLGSHTRKYVQQLKQDVGLVQMLKGGKEYINTLASAKISLNSRGEKDINYKVFEAIGVGTCSVTDYDPLYEELGFIDGVNCYFYKNYNECVEKIKLALTNNNWYHIGANGYNISRNHTYEARIKRLKNILDKNLEGIKFKE
jgi:spore maturation protein CgeB